MKAKKSKKAPNYLDYIPVRKEAQKFHENEDGNIVLHVERKSLYDKIAQKLKKTPKCSYYTMDPVGSFVWRAIDGQKTIYTIGQELLSEKGDSVEPLYERLTRYMKILELNSFISYVDHI